MSVTLEAPWLGRRQDTHRARPLVLAAHGTADPQGQAVVAGVAARAAAILGVTHRVGYVDVCGPTLAEAVDGLGEAPPAVVPFFLASGYHVRHDVPAAVRAWGPRQVVTPALGTEPEVIQAVIDGARGASTRPSGLVLVSAGSSVDSAREEASGLARLVGERLGLPADVAYLSGPGPRPAEVATAVAERIGQRNRRRAGEGAGELVLAAHLLAPGHFHRLAQRAAAESTAAGVPAVGTPPLGTHPALTHLVVRRYLALTS